MKQTETVGTLISYMLRSIPFHPNMNLNLSFSMFAISYNRRCTRLRQCQHSKNLMRTGTEFVSEISAATIFTSSHHNALRNKGYNVRLGTRR